MRNFKGSRFGLYKDLLKSSKYFKLVCGAGNEDQNEVEYLSYIYTLAGLQVLMYRQILKL